MLTPDQRHVLRPTLQNRLRWRGMSDFYGDANLSPDAIIAWLQLLQLSNPSFWNFTEPIHFWWIQKISCLWSCCFPNLWLMKVTIFLKVTSLCCCCGNANNLKLWKGRIAKEFRDFATCDLDLHSNPAQILLKLWTDFVANCQKILLNCEKDYLSVEHASFQEMFQRFCWNEVSWWGD